MAEKLIDMALILRSKNAGPLHITFDVMFDTHEKLKKVLSSSVVNQETIAKLYEVNSEQVSIITYEIVNSFKITIPRKYVSGDILDDDIYGCQQHVKLANLIIP